MTGSRSPGARLRDLLTGPDVLVLPGCADPLVARLAAGAGFEAVYATGAGIANTLLGVPDVGLVTLTELADQVRRITAAVDVPVVVDIDTGFGNAINARRAVQEIERAGAAAVQIEDQVFPKRCGHFAGKDVIPAAEMVAKIRAVLDARSDPALVVIARTDAIAVEGFEAGVERGRAYAEAGADLVFVEAPTTTTSSWPRCRASWPPRWWRTWWRAGRRPSIRRPSSGTWDIARSSMRTWRCESARPRSGTPSPSCARPATVAGCWTGCSAGRNARRWSASRRSSGSKRAIVSIEASRLSV